VGRNDRGADRRASEGDDERREAGNRRRAKGVARGALVPPATRRRYAALLRHLIFRLENLADDLDPDWMGGSWPPRLRDEDARAAIEVIRGIDAILEGRGRGDTPTLARMRVLNAIHEASARMRRDDELRLDLAGAIDQVRVSIGAWCPAYVDALARVDDERIEFALSCWPNARGQVGAKKVALRSGKERQKKGKMVAALELLAEIDAQLGDCADDALAVAWSTWRAERTVWRKGYRASRNP
jgi:hypothetical protein